MAETSEDHQQHQQQQKEEDSVEFEEDKGEKKTAPPSYVSSVSLNIWPPSQRTRDAVIHHLVETLSSPSILSKRYGSIPHDEASTLACQIEQEAFSAAAASAPAFDDGAAAPDDEGIETLQFYSKEISNRMLESVKARPTSYSSSPLEIPPPVAESTAAAAASSAAASEEISSVESEPSKA